ncbi:hypothetical protein R84B8_01421 [Treponema sp. R8-4-B8]
MPERVSTLPNYGISPGTSNSGGILTGVPFESTNAHVTFASTIRSSPRQISCAIVPLAAPFLTGHDFITNASSVKADLL